MEAGIKPTLVILLLLFFAAMTGQTFAAAVPMTLGSMAIAGTSNGVCWIGNVLETQERGFLDKITAQGVRVLDMASAASAGLVVSSEVLLSPTIFDANVTVAKHKGAPIE